MDIEYLVFLQNLRESMGGVMDDFMLFMTFLAESKATFLFLAFVYWCVDKDAGRFMGMNVSLSCTLSQMLKGVFHVERPWVRSERIHPVEEALPAAAGYSFPSGHTTRAAAVWGAFGFYELSKNSGGSLTGGVKDIGSCRQNVKKVLGGLLLVSLIIIGFSRNYLGVHAPQDVVVAFIYSVCIWFLSAHILRWSDSNSYGDILLLVVFSLATALWYAFIGRIPNAGAGVAFMLSSVLDRRVIHYKQPESLGTKALVFILGECIFLLIIRYANGLLYPFCGSFTNLVVSFVYMFYVMIPVPILCRVMDAFTSVKS